MVVIPVVRTFLRPLPFVIFPPNFLPDRWIGHIEKAKDKTPQVGQVSNTTPRPRPGGVKFEETKDNYHVFGRNRNGKEHEENGTIREEPGKGEKDSVDGSGGTDDRDE